MKSQNSFSSLFRTLSPKRQRTKKEKLLMEKRKQRKSQRRSGNGEYIQPAVCLQSYQCGDEASVYVLCVIVGSFNVLFL